MFYRFSSINWTLCSQNYNLQSFVGQVDTSGQVAFLSPSLMLWVPFYQPGQPHFWDCTGIVTPASDVLLGGCPHIHVPQLGLCQVDCDASCLSLAQAAHGATTSHSGTAYCQCTHEDLSPLSLEVTKDSQTLLQYQWYHVLPVTSSLPSAYCKNAVSLPLRLSYSTVEHFSMTNDEKLYPDKYSKAEQIRLSVPRNMVGAWACGHPASQTAITICDCFTAQRKQELPFWIQFLCLTFLRLAGPNHREMDMWRSNME